MTTAAEKTISKGLKINPFFVKNGEDPFARIVWETRTSRVTETDGTVVFEMKDVLVPSTWSQLATNILASKYCRKADVPGTTGGQEKSASGVVRRIALAIRQAGVRGGYFDSTLTADRFEAELQYLLINQVVAFNSPVWFNVGLREAYGIKGSPAGNWHWNESLNKVVLADDAYTHPQASACFIRSVKDDLMHISEGLKEEARLFKFGSGVGSNFSALRGEGEPLSNGGVSSGLMSFLHVYDANAGAIKSGGTTRRAAKMVILDADHPDVFKFVEWKAREEDKKRVLIAAGYGQAGDVNSEAERTVSGQNANNSVRLTDEFMAAVNTDGDWSTKWRTNGKIASTFKAKKLWDAICDAAWKCADPGLQFHDNVNRWHTCSGTGPIRGSNPCQPAWATVLTPEGIRTMGEISVGDTVWSGQRWTKVVRKVPTGVKPVFAYRTRAGTFYGTENHRVVQEGEKVEVKDAESIDIAFCRERGAIGKIDPVDVMDGLMIGDGTIHKASANLPYLIVGKEDHEYFTSEVAPLFIEDRSISFTSGNKAGIQAWRTKSTITPEELPKTYERAVPERFLRGSVDKVRGFLRGLFSANGSVVASARVTLKASSFRVIEAVQAMLSSLGIRSYYTVNKEHDVEFYNGVYTCKESYDINIGVAEDRRRFRDLIGFIHKDKMRKLDESLRPAMKKPKSSYGIVSVEPLGEEDVYDIEVDAPEHTYWTGGMLVSNCSEFMFLDDTSCNLASLNLVKFLLPEGRFDVEAFKAAVRVLFIAMEILVDYASYPSKDVAQNSHDYRPLGIGYANLGALLMRNGIPYDSDRGRAVASSITSLMTATAYLTSAEMAAVKGPFPGYAHNAEPMMRVMQQHRDASEKLREAQDATNVWNKAIELGSLYGFRNAQASVLAPTGTIGLLMDCDTTGVEPEFSLVKTKKLAGGGETTIVNQSVRAALKALGYSEEGQNRIVEHIKAKGSVEGAGLMTYDHAKVFSCAIGHDAIAPMGHVKMMAAVQPFISGAISKTVNLPAKSTREDVSNAYMEAWRLGLKAIALYRDGSKTAQPLEGKKDAKDDAKPVEAPEHKCSEHVERRRLPDKRPGDTYRIRIGGQKIYLRTGNYPDGALGEIFIDLAKSGSVMRSMMNTFAISVSIGLQHGVPLAEYVKSFKHVAFEPRGMVRGYKGVKMASSIPDLVAKVLEREYLVKEEVAQETHEAPSVEPQPVVAASTAHSEDDSASAPLCSECGNQTERSGSCHVCTNCGTSAGCS